VMHAIRTVDARREADPDFDLVCKTLEERIRTPKLPDDRP
jgi:hypothetical protein